MLQIFEHKSRGKWAHVTDGKNIIYVESDIFGTFKLISCHKPNIITGTGFILDDGGVTAENLEEAIIKNIEVFAPSWATQTDIDATKKWENAEQFMNYEKKFWMDIHLVPFNIATIIKNV